MRKNPSVTGSLDPSIQSSLRRKTSRAAKPEAGLLSRTQFVCSLFRNTSQPTMSRSSMNCIGTHFATPLFNSRFRK